MKNGILKNIEIQEVKARMPLPIKETKVAIKFIKKYHEGIVEKWTNFFVQNKKVSCESVNTKIK